MDRLLAMGDVTTTPDFVPPVAFLPARVILGLCVALVALGLLFANSRPDPRNAPPPKATTSRAIPHKASQSPVAQYAAAIAWFNPELTDDWDRRLAGAILRSCRRQGIDGRLLMAVMAVESNFDIGARPQAKIDRKVSHLRRCLQQTFHSSDAPSSALGMSAVLTHYGMRHRARAQVWRLYSGMCGQK